MCTVDVHAITTLVDEPDMRCVVEGAALLYDDAPALAVAYAAIDSAKAHARIVR